MDQNPPSTAPQESRKLRFGCLQVFLIVLATVLVTALAAGWWVKHYIYASTLSPTKLTDREQKVLDSKLARLEKSGQRPRWFPRDRAEEPPAPLEPERYSEAGADREIRLTERELNSLIANQPEVAQRVAIDLADNQVSVKLVVPMDEEILFLGGKTLRLNLGVALAYEKGRPVVALQGVSLGGIPLPNAWLGNLKYKNLVDEFGGDGGFWTLFTDGVEDLRVQEGQIQIRLKE